MAFTLQVFRRRLSSPLREFAHTGRELDKRGLNFSGERLPQDLSMFRFSGASVVGGAPFQADHKVIVQIANLQILGHI